MRAVLAAVLLAAVLLVGAVVGGGPGPVSADPLAPRTYQPPTAAAVLDPFRPPAQRWEAGNRGIEYATRPGDRVGAIGPGTVTFAGPVAGRLAVTVLHPDGLRSSYVGPGSAQVRVGERVAGATVVVVADGPIHLGVRRGTAYLDPASLWGSPVHGGHVHLVPHGEPRRDRVAGGGSMSSAPRAWSTRPWLGLLRLPASPMPGATLGSGLAVATLANRPTDRCAAHTQLAWSPSNGRFGSPRRSGIRLRRNRWRGEVRERARRHHEAAARGQGPLRTPDPPVEPEDEAVHLR